MTRLMDNRPGARPAKNDAKSRRWARPDVEALEGRQLLTVVYEGGALLSHVEAQALYLGKDWSSSATYKAQAAVIDGYLNFIVNSTHMDALTNAGYNVGRGTSTSGVFDPVVINKNNYLQDSTIRVDLQAAIKAKLVQPPDANRLYFIFVEDNVAVQNGSDSSLNGFTGYHGAFAGTDASGHPASIRYAMITYPGGSVGNLGVPGFGTFDSITDTTSHELAEGVTDPDVNYKALGWYDSSPNAGEVGDIVNGQSTYLNGYAVQRISDKHDQAMTPAGATSQRPVSFVLLSNGYLYEHSATGWLFLTSGVTSVSNQGVDNSGHAMVDVMTTGGYDYEYYDTVGFGPPASYVKSAVAGQGFSYILQKDGSLYSYDDATNAGALIHTGVASIDAGTDRYGVSAVDFVLTNGTGYQYSVSSGLRLLSTDVKTLSAGELGQTEILMTNGSAYDYNATTNKKTLLGSGVAQITAGFDASGFQMIDLIDTGGTLHEYNAASGKALGAYNVGAGWIVIATGVKSVSKAHAGVTELVYKNGKAYEHSSKGLVYLNSPAIVAV